VIRARTITAALLSLLAATSAFAQYPFRAAGHVRDSLGTPIAGATVSSADARTETDSVGKFSLPLKRTDSTTVTIRRLGFASVTFTMPTDSLALNDLDIQLDAVARALPEVGVRESRYARVPTLESFATRRRDKEGFGFFLGREEIQQREGAPLSSLLAQAKGVSIVRTRNGRNALRFARWNSKGQSCAPHTWLDGALVKDLEIDDVRASDIEAVELYPNAASAPPEFDTGSRFACGIVVLWTRRPALRTR
jgi:Carboxypeptidase regulatory-like domain